MGQVLHGSATTTEAVRRAIQNSQESLRALAVLALLTFGALISWLGGNPTRVVSWDDSNQTWSWDDSNEDRFWGDSEGNELWGRKGTNTLKFSSSASEALATALDIDKDLANQLAQEMGLLSPSALNMVSEGLALCGNLAEVSDVDCESLSEDDIKTVASVVLKTKMYFSNQEARRLSWAAIVISGVAAFATVGLFIVGWLSLRK